MRRQNPENDVGVGREWAVVEREDDLMVVERQHLLVLHAANVTEFMGTNGKHSARAERVGIAGTFRSKGRNAGTGEH